MITRALVTLSVALVKISAVVRSSSGSFTALIFSPYILLVQHNMDYQATNAQAQSRFDEKSTNTYTGKIIAFSNYLYIPKRVLRIIPYFITRPGLRSTLSLPFAPVPLEALLIFVAISVAFCDKKEKNTSRLLDCGQPKKLIIS